MPRNLRARMKKLAEQDQALRPFLTEILEKTAREKTSTVVVRPAPIIVKQAPIIVNDGGNTVSQPQVIQNPPGSLDPFPANSSVTGVPKTQAPPMISNLMSAEKAQNGFRIELQPELERLLSLGMTREEAARELTDVVEKAFQNKDMLYNILIRYQSSFEGDSRYLESLTSLIGTWASTTTGA